VATAVGWMLGLLVLPVLVWALLELGAFLVPSQTG